MDYKENEMVQEAELKTEATEAVAEAEAVVAAEATKPPEPSIDWKARAEEAEARRVTLEANMAKLTKEIEDNRGREIGQLRQKERDDLAVQNTEMLRALATAVRTQEWDAYDTKVKEINEQASKSHLTAEVEAAKQEAYAELQQIDEDMGGTLDSHPLFESTRLYWRQAQSTGNSAYYLKAVAEAHKASVKLAKEETASQAKTHLKAIKDAEAAATKAAKEAAGVHDLALGPAAGGMGITKDNIDALHLQGKVSDQVYRLFLQTGEL